jgi:hypothetical protein
MLIQISENLCRFCSERGHFTFTSSALHRVAVFLSIPSVRRLPLVPALNGPVLCPDVVQCVEHTDVIVDWYKKKEDVKLGISGVRY